MEDLNQRQLVLLVILVSFVTSIATGIITASLMDHAPPAVTRGVDRVVERTVEYVSPTEVEKTEVTEVKEIVEERVIDRGDDIIIDVNEQIAPQSFLVLDGRGGFVSRGMFLKDKSIAVLPFSASEGEELILDTQNEEEQKVKEEQTEEDEEDAEDVEKVEDGSITAEVVFSSDLGFSVASTTKNEFPSSFDKSNMTPHRGATVIHIGGGSRDELYVGRVAWFEKDEEDDNILALGVDGIDKLQPGAILANLSGEIWGFQTGGVAGEYTPLSVIEATVSEYLEDSEGEAGEE
ncbi:MAG: hypothetical protein ACQESA_01355 [Patescibacteria group bacterium]